MPTPQEQEYLLSIVQDPELSRSSRLDAASLIEPRLKDASSAAQDDFLQAAIQVKKLAGVKPEPIPEVGAPTKINNAVITGLSGAKEVLGDLGETLAIPGRLAVKGLQRVGVDTETPRPPLLSVPIAKVGQPAYSDTSVTGNPVLPLEVPKAPLSEQVPGIVDMVAPFGGMKAAYDLLSKLRSTPKTVAPVVPAMPTQKPVTLDPMADVALGNRPMPTQSLGAQPLPKSPLAGIHEELAIQRAMADPMETLSKLEQQYPPLEKGPPATEPVREALRARLLGIPMEGLEVPRVTRPEAETINQVSNDLSKMVSPQVDLEKTAKVIAKKGKAPEVMPGMLSRFFNPALDVLKQTGPLGKQLSNTFWDYMDRVERMTSHVVMNTDAEYARILGRRSWMEQKEARKFNPTKDYSMDQLYNIQPEEVKQIVDYLYTGGKMIPPGIKDGRSPAELMEVAKVFFDKGTKPVSMNEGLKLVTIPDPLTPGGRMPYGSPDMFFPHKPMDPEKYLRLQDLRVRQLFEAAKAQQGFKGTFSEYKDKLNKFAESRNAQVTVGMHGWVGKRREFDASELGRPSEVLDALGYDTDPLRVLFSFAGNGFRSGEAKLIEPQVQGLVTGVKEGIARSSENRNKGVWVDQLTDRVIGKPPQEVVDLQTRNIFNSIRHWNDTTLLQMATLPQFNQMTYIVGRAGLQTTLEAAGKIAKGEMTGLPERSGALFTTLLNEFTVPSTMSARLSTGSMRMSGFTSADAELRQFGAVVGAHWADKMAKILVAHPDNQKAKAIFEELRIDPKEVIKNGGLTQDLKETAAQNFANLTSGRTDVRTLPLWITEDDPLKQLFYQYKKFLFNNSSELKRQLLDSNVGAGEKTIRAARLLGTAGVMGELTRELQIGVSNFDNPFKVEGQKRVAPPLRWLYKQSPAAAYTVDRVVFGLGSIVGLLAYSAMESKVDALYSTVFGPTPGFIASTVTGASKAWQGTLEDKRDAEKGLIRELSRRTPVIGPIMPTAVDEYYKRPFAGAAVKPYQPIKPYGPTGP